MAYVRELPNGRYRILWRENAVDDYGSPIKGQYRQRSETVATVKAAERRRIDIEREIESGHDPSAKRDKAATALGTYASRYFDANESRIGRVTLDGYRKIYHRHIAATFGSRPVGSILPSDVSTWFSALLSGDSNRFTDAATRELAKRDPKTAKQALGVLRRICNVAVLDSAIIANPALVKLTTSTKRNGRRRFKHCPLTPAQIATLAGYIANDRHNPIYGLVVSLDGFTGLRAAEVAGLEIADLTLSDHQGTAGAVRVDRTKTKDGAVWVTESTKTDESERTVPLEPWLADDLRAYLREHPKPANQQHRCSLVGSRWPKLRLRAAK